MSEPSPPREGVRTGDRGASESNAGAWAAAALVIGLGGLGFGVASMVRADALQDRVAQLEASRRDGPSMASATRGPDPSEAPRPVASAMVDEQVNPTDLQPPDPVRAEAEVIEAFVTVYDGTRPGDERSDAIDDPRGVGAAFQAAAGGRFAALAASSRSVVTSVRFNSAVEAVVTYRVESDAGVDLGERSGVARLTGGRWKVTRATVCADLASVGAPCDG